MIAGSFRDFGIPQVGFFVSNLLLPFEFDDGSRSNDGNGNTNEDKESNSNNPYYCVALTYMKTNISSSSPSSKHENKTIVDGLEEDDIDFDWDSECKSGLPQPVDYRFHTRYAKDHPEGETMRPGGSNGVPVRFLLGFFWRNIIRRNLPSWIGTKREPPLSPDSLLPFPAKLDEVFRDVC